MGMITITNTGPARPLSELGSLQGARNKVFYQFRYLLKKFVLNKNVLIFNCSIFLGFKSSISKLNVDIKSKPRFSTFFLKISAMLHQNCNYDFGILSTQTECSFDYNYLKFAMCSCKLFQAN